MLYVFHWRLFRPVYLEKCQGEVPAPATLNKSSLPSHPAHSHQAFLLYKQLYIRKSTSLELINDATCRDHENIISLFRETKKKYSLHQKIFQVEHKRGP